MVSGFFTSPCDHDRILSGEASEMRMALKLSGFFGFSNRLNKSSIIRLNSSGGPCSARALCALRPSDAPRPRRPYLSALALGLRPNSLGARAVLGRFAPCALPMPPDPVGHT